MILLTRTDCAKDYSAGVLEIPGEPPFATLERPWLNNQHDISCIPPGDYQLQQFVHPEFGVTWYFTHVPGRSEIMLHWGNYVDDTKGCILIGSFFDPNPKPHIGASRIAFNRFRNSLKDKAPVIRIQECR